MYKGKLFERKGRKAMGLREISYDCQAAETLTTFLLEQAYVYITNLACQSFGKEILKGKECIKMKKALVALVLSFILLFPTSLAMAAPKAVDNGSTQAVEVQQPATFDSSITVGKDGGRFQVGFINIEFKKSFLDSSSLPAVFDAQIYAENGQVYVEFTPDTPLFYKQVHIRVDSYSGYIYDRAQGKNIFINIKKDQILAPHFSRYALND